jgi:hypothetical protein
MLATVGWRRSFRASPVGRRKLATQTICLGPFVSGLGQKMGRGPVHLAGATHPVRASYFDEF